MNVRISTECPLAQLFDKICFAPVQKLFNCCNFLLSIWNLFIPGERDVGLLRPHLKLLQKRDTRISYSINKDRWNRHFAVEIWLIHCEMDS